MMLRYLVLTIIFGVGAVVHAQTATQRSSHFRVRYPQTLDSRDATHVLDLLESNRSNLIQRVADAGIDVHFPNLEIVFNATTGDFTARTGMPPWAAAATSNNRIELQPLALLKQRRVLETTLRHELAHVLIDTLANSRTPRWLSEGMAIYLAGEGRLLEHYRSHKLGSAETVEQSLINPQSLAGMRTAYANAYALVRELIRTGGEKKIWISIRVVRV